MNRLKTLIASLAMVIFLMPAVQAAEWRVDPAASSISFSGTHAGRAFAGVFEQWTATISFDPDALDAASVVVTVQTGSAKTGTRLYDSTLPKDEWFATDDYPTAVFETNTFTTTGEGRYAATGNLTIKGQATPLTLPFTLTIADDRATMAGEVVLDRIALDMGVKSDPDATWVSQEIPVTISLVATR